jgi:hypothetical protein
MASIIKTSINLDAIQKDKIIQGKKGKYLPIVITINNDVDNFGNSGPVIIEQSKDERDAKAPKIYLGNVKVVWTDGNNVSAAPAQGNTQSISAASLAPQADDLPF